MQALAQSSLSSCVAASLGAAASSSARVSTNAALSLSVGDFAAGVAASKRPAVAKRSSARRGVVCMSQAPPVATGYASALIEVAKSNNALEKVHKDVEALHLVLENAELEGFLANPVVDEKRKKSILKTMADDASFSPFTLNFLFLLVDKKRIQIVKEVVSAFQSLYCEATNTQIAEVVSAVKLENSQQALIAKKLQSLTKAKNIKLKNVVDPSLIAGFIIKYGADFSSSIDMSVKGQLDRLTSQFDLVEAL